MIESYRLGSNAEFGKDVEIGCGSFIDDNVVIGNGVRIGRSVLIHSGSYIGDITKIGDHCIIGHLTKLQLQKVDFSACSQKAEGFIVEDPVTKVGRDSIIRSGSVIYKHVVMGEKLRTGHSVLIREHTTIGRHVVVGTNAVLDGYIKVGDNSLIQSNCYVCQTATIGKGVFVAPGCVFMDNKKIVLGEGLNGGTVGDYVRIGGGTKILPDVKIGNHSFIGAGSVVTKDVPENSVALGNPAVVTRTLSKDEIERYIESIECWVYR